MNKHFFSDKQGVAQDYINKDKASGDPICHKLINIVLPFGHSNIIKPSSS